jgi:hypothetical protein
MFVLKVLCVSFLNVGCFMVLFSIAALHLALLARATRNLHRQASHLVVLLREQAKSWPIQVLEQFMTS